MGTIGPADHWRPVQAVNWVAAALYDRVMASLEGARLAQWRRELLCGLSGRVLEIGAGTGRNLEWYPPAVTELVLAEPDRHMRARLAATASAWTGNVPGGSARAGGAALQVVDAPAEALPFPDGHFNAVVSTLVLCSVYHPRQAAAEMRRVLGPGGCLFVIEHVAAGPASRAWRWQARVEPVWKRLAGNCHLTRDTASTLREAGFNIAGLRAESLPMAPTVVRPTIRGRLTVAG
jgi:ubiquinone/menaquinone biosynthesis C-methylase UbiE